MMVVTIPLPTGLTLPTLLPVDLTAESGTNTGDGVILTQAPSSSVSGVNVDSDGTGSFQTEAISNGGPLFESDLALPIGLGVAGGVLLLCACLVVALVFVKRRKRTREIKTQGNYDFSAQPKANVYGEMPASRASPPDQGVGVVGVYASARRDTQVTQYLGLSNVSAPSDVHSTYGNIALKSDYAPDSEISSNSYGSYTAGPAQ